MCLYSGGVGDFFFMCACFKYRFLFFFLGWFARWLCSYMQMMYFVVVFSAFFFFLILTS